MKVEGTVVREELGPGVYLLETADGQRYALKGGDAGLLKDGQQVTVEGDLNSGAIGIGMTGNPVLAVKGYELR